MSKNDPGWVRRNVDRTVRPDRQSPEQAKRAPWVLLAVFAAIILIAAGVWALRVFVFEPSQAQPAPVATETENAPDPEPSTDTGADSCLDNTEKDISGSAPTASRWVVERWAAIPEVEGAGPCDDRGNFRVGFAHTQTGAVLATYHYFLHGIPASADAGTEALLDYALIDGPLKDSILQQVVDVENGVEARVPDSQYSGVELGGYKIQSYADDAAVIELLVQNASAAGSLTVKLVWSDGDWRIDPASANGWGTTQTNVRIQDFVSWSPQAAG